MVGAKKNTKMKSHARARLPQGVERRPVMCRRCAGEVNRFPSLVCWLDPTSTAGKCGDCKRDIILITTVNNKI